MVLQCPHHQLHLFSSVCKRECRSTRETEKHNFYFFSQYHCEHFYWYIDAWLQPYGEWNQESLAKPCLVGFELDTPDEEDKIGFPRISNVIMKTLPKAQRTRGLSSSYQSNFFRSHHKFLPKSWSNFICYIRQRINFKISTKHQHLD